MQPAAAPRRAPSGAALAAAVVLLLGAAAPAYAQCRPPQSSNEAKLLAFYEAPILFGTVRAPEMLAAGALRVGAELVPMPNPDPAIERSEYCNSKGEHTRLSPVFGRPRLQLGLPFGFALEGSYVPPVTVGEAQPHLGSAALSRVVALPGRPRGVAALLALRAHATVGRVRGPITCSASALQQSDPFAPCYGSTESRDTFRPTMWGGEAALGAWGAGRRAALFLGGGLTWLRPRFQVGFTDGNGVVDSTRVEVDLRRASAFGGVTLRATSRLDLSAQLHAMAGDVTTWRVAGDWRLR